MRRTTVLAAASFALAVLLTGCSGSPQSGNAIPLPTSETSSAPAPTSSERSTGGEELPANGAPEVSNPLDTSAFAQDPCGSLTEAQITDLLGGPIGGEPDIGSAVGPTCNWHGPQFASISVNYSTIHDGLSSVYAHKDTLAVFDPLPAIQRYPVVAYSSAEDRQEDGGCQVQVGTSNNSVIDIGVRQSDKNVGKSDPCEAAHGVATMVTNNIVAAR